MSKTTPRYKLWEALQIAIDMASMALTEVRSLARIPGPPGEPGLGFDDFDIEYDGERSFTFKWQRGDLVKKKSFEVPVMIYRDVFKEGTAYKRGDVVTWAGSSWVAKGETKARPGDGPDWTLSVKRGRDGKEVVTLPPGPPKPVKI